ncbi:MAG: hypothetical protein Q8W44_00205 [Candidatus Palauibacterales bacterium]|nr:hypothetical protein [Candidatus Palauibacterales bacterium]
MSEIDREQVRHVARLARLELSGEEVDRLADELGRVLSRFRELEEAEVDGAGPGTGEEPAGESADVEAEGDGSGLRPDEPDADPLARGPGELAPEWEDGFFLVPRLRALGDDAGDDG